MCGEELAQSKTMEVEGREARPLAPASAHTPIHTTLTQELALIHNLMRVQVRVPYFCLLTGPLLWGQGFLLKSVNVQELFC